MTGIAVIVSALVLLRFPFGVMAHRYIVRAASKYMADGSEIVLPCGEAFDAAVEDVIGSWTVRSNIGALDGRITGANPAGAPSPKGTSLARLRGEFRGLGTPAWASVPHCTLRRG